MAIDSAEKRASAAWTVTGLGVNTVTPNASPDQEWRQESGWGYMGVAAGDPVVAILAEVDYTQPERVLPIYTPQFADEVVTGVHVVSATARARSSSNGYKVRVGVGKGGNITWIGEWNQANNALVAGTQRALVPASLNYPLDDGVEVFVGIDKTGSPASLDGLKVQVDTERVGEVSEYEYPRPDAPGYPGQRSVSRALFDDPAFEGLDVLIEALNGTAVTRQTASVSLSDETTTPAYVGYILSEYLHLQHQESSGTDGGGATSGSWQTRTLNTEVTNEISGASLSSNAFTLPAGTYYVRIRTPFNAVRSFQSRLYNVTDSAAELMGEVGRGNAASDPLTMTYSEIVGRITISDAKTFRVESQVELTNAGDGYGHGHTFGTNIYTNCEIWKIR